MNGIVSFAGLLVLAGAMVNWELLAIRSRGAKKGCYWSGT